MGKSQGLIGNFNGKVGNMVGFKVSQSNNGTNQGVRIYQPVRKNPKTAAQAEQRAKYAPIFATYRALKSIIDRGQESLPYGNASRIAWLKKAFRSAVIPWTTQGSTVKFPLGCQLTQGSLKDILFKIDSEMLIINIAGVSQDSHCESVDELTVYLMRQYPFLKEGDQITLVIAEFPYQSLQFRVLSYILNRNDGTPITNWLCANNMIEFEADDVIIGGAIIISREGAHGEHLRSTSFLTLNAVNVKNAPYDAASKTAAIESYMASGAINDNWAEDPI